MMMTKQNDAVAMTEQQLDAVAGGAAFIGMPPNRRSAEEINIMIRVVTYQSALSPPRSERFSSHATHARTTDRARHRD